MAQLKKKRVWIDEMHFSRYLELFQQNYRTWLSIILVESIPSFSKYM